MDLGFNLIARDTIDVFSFKLSDRNSRPQGNDYIILVANIISFFNLSEAYDNN